MTDNLFNPEAFEQMPGQISMEQVKGHVHFRDRYSKRHLVVSPSGRVVASAGSPAEAQESCDELDAR